MADDKIPEDKPIEWTVVIAGILLGLFGIASPVIIFAVGTPFSEWGLFSWEPYTCILAFVIYVIIGGQISKKIGKI